ncbi:phosphoglucosamine mutase [bacterium]|nr:phosphoglucosamine mutase [bacterium]
MEVLFGTDGVRGRANENLTPEFALKLGLAVGSFLKRDCSKIILGKDTRLSSDMLESAFAAGLCAAGMEVLETGVITTPGVAFLASFNNVYGAVISASHNPFDENGIKLIHKNGFKLPDEWEEEIEKIFLDNGFEYAPSAEIGKRTAFHQGASLYKDFLKSKADFSLKGMKLVVDTANGAGHNIAPALLRELGADVIVINDTPDGKNINRDCGAVHPERMAEEVKKHRAMLGISLDGDGDRAIFADEQGEIIYGDGILYIFATYMMEKGILRGPVVTTYMTNSGVEMALAKRGIKMVRVPIGDKYVARKMKEIGATLGGEQSGHIILFQHLPTGDGILTTLQLLKVILEKGKPLSQLKDYVLFPQKLVNIKVKNPQKWEKDEKVMAVVRTAESALAGKGRILIRASGTEDKLRIMVEGEDEKEVENLTNELYERIKKIVESEND